MLAEKFHIQGPVLFTPNVFADERGHFFESYSKQFFINNGVDFDFVQDNQSLSNKGTVRGLHFQAPPYDQGKLVRVSRGTVVDIIVDIRKSSPTYGQNITVELSETNFKQLWVPPGFAHGFSVLEDSTIFQYKCTNYYNKLSEGGLYYNDPVLCLNWQVENHVVSEKDQLLPYLKDFISPFN
ncbi:MAG: dTDP-4-dehydrorhamnose 3,5-epimerase [Bacteroidia bacterium]